MKTAFITGISGQDGAYLSRHLLGEGYRVVGLVRPGTAREAATAGLAWLGIAREIELVWGDLSDGEEVLRLLSAHCPDEIYNLAAHSLVRSSWQEPVLTLKSTAQGPLNLLEAIRLDLPSARFFQASSSEMYSSAEAGSLDENTPFRPRSPYAAAKLYAHWTTVNCRETLGLHASSGIMFNHESPLRGVAFVTRKITDGAARIKRGRARELRLGSLDSERDWGHARDHVAAMHLMLQQEQADDYVVATGRTASVREICRIAFGHVGLRFEDYVTTDPAFVRPTEIRRVAGNWSKAGAHLGWAPKTSLEDTIVEMVEADLARLSP